MTENQLTELDVLFPGKEVVIKVGEQEYPVLVTPLSLEDLPRVAQVFGRLMKIAEEGSLEPAEIAAKGIEELLLLIPYCISLPASRIPATEVPDLLEVIIEQNITETVVGKWKSLVQKLIDQIGVDLPVVPGLSGTMKSPSVE